MRRAVDSEGEVLEILVQPQRDKATALRLLRKLLRRQGFVPTVIVTDKLRSYDARFQINQVGSAFCFRPCGRLQHIQCTTTFNQASDASTVPDRSA
jgi:transposase-like protein